MDEKKKLYNKTYREKQKQKKQEEVNNEETKEEKKVILKEKKAEIKKDENIEKSFFFQTLKNKFMDTLITISIPIIIKLGANLFMKRSKQEPKQEEPLQQFTFPPLNF